MRVLVIDDARAVRALVARMLAEIGRHAVVEAADGSAGLAALAAGPAFDLAVVDWHMPVLDGLGFVRAARAMPAAAGLRILMCTTENGAGEIAEALAAGADEFVMKPFDLDTLRSKLALLGLDGG